MPSDWVDGSASLQVVEDRRSPGNIVDCFEARQGEAC